jgi:hypothetical protein
VGHIDGMKLRLIAANDSLFIRSFGVAHTPFAPVFVPCLPRMMTDDFITADFATVTACKLYRFHYNLLVTVPVNWSAMKRISSPQITSQEAFKLFRLWNKLGRGFGLTF